MILYVYNQFFLKHLEIHKNRYVMDFRPIVHDLYTWYRRRCNVNFI